MTNYLLIDTLDVHLLQITNSWPLINYHHFPLLKNFKLNFITIFNPLCPQSTKTWVSSLIDYPLFTSHPVEIEFGLLRELIWGFFLKENHRWRRRNAASVSIRLAPVLLLPMEHFPLFGWKEDIKCSFHDIREGTYWKFDTTYKVEF